MTEIGPGEQLVAGRNINWKGYRTTRLHGLYCYLRGQIKPVDELGILLILSQVGDFAIIVAVDNGRSGSTEVLKMSEQSSKLLLKIIKARFGRGN